MKINLLKNKAFINGKWISADNKDSFKVRNPFNDTVIESVPNLGKEETKRAVQAAYTALKSWSKKTAVKRAEILRKWFELQLKHKEELAFLLTLEQGKPIRESRNEISYGASFIEWFAEEAKRIYGDVIPSPFKNKRIVVLRQPIGVVAAITPWNFPNAMITRKVAPALAAGCTIVVKPAESTPLSSLALAALAEQAGIPKGVFNIITTNKPAEVGCELTSNRLVRKISFTGSTSVGKVLIKQSADTVKKTSMELGGNAPFMVFEDANLDAAIKGLIASKFRNTGQTCICTNRIFVQEQVYEVFLEKLTLATKKIKMGNGLDENVELGPLINRRAVAFVDNLVRDAVSKGARITTGGYLSENNKNFYPPTVLCEVNSDMKIFHSEIFGAVAAVIKFSTEQEAISMANNTPFGLASYFYTNNHARIWRVSEALEYGMVGVNTGLISTNVAPFGGIKESGNGREGSKYGIEDYLETKYMCLGGIAD
ncbi:MAG: NAD-dependent succinate-semialdehyde dehydrogenase [Tenacibaculum sp.]